MTDLKNVKIGTMVHWFEGGSRIDGREAAALVIGKNHGSVSLLVHGINRDFRIECSKHLDDPTAKEWERNSDGGWDFIKDTNERTNAKTSGAVVK